MEPKETNIDRQKGVVLEDFQVHAALDYWAKTRHMVLGDSSVALIRRRSIANTGGCCPCSMERLCPCPESVEEVQATGHCRCRVFIKKEEAPGSQGP